MLRSRLLVTIGLGVLAGIAIGVTVATVLPRSGDDVAALSECAETAAEKGVVLALENHGGVTTTARQVIDLIETVGSEWLRVNLDTGNFGMDPDTDPYEGLATVAPYAVAAHYKVSMRTPDGKKPVDLVRVVDTLRGAGCKGFLNVEYEEDEEPRDAIPQIAEALRRATKA